MSYFVLRYVKFICFKFHGNMTISYAGAINANFSKNARKEGNIQIFLKSKIENLIIRRYAPMIKHILKMIWWMFQVPSWISSAGAMSIKFRGKTLINARVKNSRTAVLNHITILKPIKMNYFSSIEKWSLPSDCSIFFLYWLKITHFTAVFCWKKIKSQSLLYFNFL